MSAVTIEIKDAEAVAHDLADLICWWEGFKAGLKLGDPYGSDINPVANNGVEAARRLRSLINYALNDQKK